MTFTQFSADGAWCWFQDPRAVHFEGRHDRTYFGWLSHDGDVIVASHDHNSGHTSTSTLHRDFEADDHDAPVFAIDQDGHVLVFYTKHVGPDIRWRRSTTPEDISSFGEEHAISPSDGHTYPIPQRLADEDDRLYLFYRAQENEKHVLAYVTSDDDGRTWSDNQVLVTSTGYRDYGIVYPKVSGDGNSRIDIAMSHCDYRANSPHQDIRHIMLSEETVRRADGRELATSDEFPLELAELPCVFDSRVQWMDAWVWDCATFGRNPEIVYASFPDCDEHRYRWARWTGEEWVDRSLTNAGRYITSGNREKYYSAGICLDHDQPGTCYLAVGDHDGSVLQRWTTTDDGHTWTVNNLTDSATQNIRPVVPRNRHQALQVLWMRGSYTYFCEQYDTAIVGTGQIDQSGSD